MDLRQYVRIENSITRTFLRAWRPMSAELFAPIADALDAENYREAFDKAAQIDLEPLAKKVVETVKGQLYGAAVLGAKMASGGEDPAFKVGTYASTFAKIGHQLTLSIEHNMTVAVYRQLVQLIAKLQQGQVQKDAKRYVREFVSFQKSGDSSLQLISSLHTSRLAVWGFTAEADFRGVTEYRLNAVLDGRTSDFCRFIHGKTFRVEDAKEKVLAALNVEDPNDLRTVHPWPKQTVEAMTEYKTLSNDELRARGFLIPPFHPGCRTLCMVTGHEKSVVKPLPEPDDHKEVVTPEAFDAIGVKNPGRLVEQWNQLIGKPPADVLTALTGLTRDVLVTKPLGEQKFFTFTEDGQLKMRAVGEIYGSDSDAAISQVYDPDQGSLTQNFAEFSGPSAATITEMYRNAAKQVKQLGGSSYVVVAGGESGAYTHARMGFVPADADEWLRLQTEIEADLQPGGPLAELWPKNKDLQLALLAILDHQDEKGFWALASFPEIGEQLLAGREIRLAYYPDDAEAKTRYEAYFP